MISDNDWISIYNSQLDWAYLAKDKFVNKLEIDNFKKLFINEKSDIELPTCIATYGESQQGKTALILNILGIDDDGLKKALRGGSKDGDSSTKTAMLYLKSEDDYFYYNGKEVDTLEKFEREIIVLKENVESNKKIIGVVEIKIPSKYFKPEAKQNVSIIDLPGVGSCNESEKSHVLKQIHDLLPHIDLILIVTKINAMEYLKSKDYKIPQIDDWRYFPERFRIVLTYSGSDDTVRRRLENSEIKAKSDLYEYAEELLKRDLSYESEKIKVYPIENDPIRNHKVEIFEAIKEDLINDIYSVDNKLGKFKIFCSYWKKLEKIKSDKIEKQNKEITDIENQIRCRREKINSNSELIICNLQKKEDKIIELKEQMQNVNILNWNCKRILKQPEKKTANSIRTEIELCLEDVKNDILKRCNEIQNKTGKEIFINFSESKNEVDEYVQIVHQLEKYWFPDNRYSSEDKFNKTYIRSKKACQLVIDNMRRKVNSELIILKNKLENEINKIELEKQKYYNRIKIIAEDKKLDKLIENKMISKKSLEDYEIRAQKDIENAKKFREIMLNAYMEEEKRLVTKINSNSTTALEKFYLLLQIALENRKIIEILGGISGE